MWLALKMVEKGSKGQIEPFQRVTDFACTKVQHEQLSSRIGTGKNARAQL